jgi:hypothetical protein
VQKEVHCTAQLDHLPSFGLALTESSTQATKAEREAAVPVKLCSVLPFALLEEEGIWCRLHFCMILNVFQHKLKAYNHTFVKKKKYALEYCSLATKT